MEGKMQELITKRPADAVLSLVEGFPDSRLFTERTCGTVHNIVK